MNSLNNIPTHDTAKVGAVFSITNAQKELVKKEREGKKGRKKEK